MVNKMKNKNNNIVVLRFIAIILVTFGHAIVIYDPAWGFLHSNYSSSLLVYIKHIINIIQMPLFFSISGYLFYNTINKQSRLKMIIKKFKRLMIPFFIF